MTSERFTKERKSCIVGRNEVDTQSGKEHERPTYDPEKQTIQMPKPLRTHILSLAKNEC